MNYIILDLEWNQGNEQREKQRKDIPFEIIEIGAVKMNDRMEICGGFGESGPLHCDCFHELIKPQVYREMHNMTRQILHMDIKDLQKGSSFPEVMERFLAWCASPCCGQMPGRGCGEAAQERGAEAEGRGGAVSPSEQCEYVFGTWGPQDLTELQRNMRYYQMPPFGKGPLKFYDVQKLFSIAFEDGKSRRNLEYAVDFLDIPKDGAFHRALSDAYYTAKVLERIHCMETGCLPQGKGAPDNGEQDGRGAQDKSHPSMVLEKVSFDTFQLPESRKEEVRIIFDDYAKYISRPFDDKTKLLEDREVTSTRCYLCRRNLKRKIKWFTPNGKHYYSVSYCNIHGYMKGKIRVRKAENDRVYAVKTLKFISEEEAEGIFKRKERSAEMKRMKHKKKK